jgi:hypothetical protein
MGDEMLRAVDVFRTGMESPRGTSAWFEGQRAATLMSDNNANGGRLFQVASQELTESELASAVSLKGLKL